LAGTDVVRGTGGDRCSGTKRDKRVRTCWNEAKQLGLFTSLFPDAVADAADGFGDQDGRVEGRELEDYLRDRLPAEALRTNGWRQRPIFDGLDHLLWGADSGPHRGP
jgi:hypothetical protein